MRIHPCFLLQKRLDRAAAAAAVQAAGDRYSALLREGELDGLAAAASAQGQRDDLAPVPLSVGMAVVLDSRLATSEPYTLLRWYFPHACVTFWQISRHADRDWCF